MLAWMRRCNVKVALLQTEKRTGLAALFVARVWPIAVLGDEALQGEERQMFCPTSPLPRFAAAWMRTRLGLLALRHSPAPPASA